jgi:hypothetical protein
MSEDEKTKTIEAGDLGLIVDMAAMSRGTQELLQAAMRLSAGDSREQVFAAYVASGAAAIILRCQIEDCGDARVLDALDKAMELVAKERITNWKQFQAKREQEERAEKKAATGAPGVELQPTQPPAKA